MKTVDTRIYCAYDVSKTFQGGTNFGSFLLNKFFGTNFKKDSIFRLISYHSHVHISVHGQKSYSFKQSFTSKYYLVEQFQYLA